MTTKAGQASSRPIIPSGVKAPEVKPDAQVTPSVATEPEGDRLALTTLGAQSVAATASPSLGEVVAKVTAAAGAPQAQFSPPETKPGIVEERPFPWLERQPLVPVLNSPFGQGEAPQESSQNVLEVLSGRPTTVVTTEGARVEVTLTKVGALTGAGDIYELTAGTNKVTVMVATDVDAKGLLPRAAEIYANFPERQRRLLKTLVLEAASNPANSYWSKVYMPNFTSAATGGNGCITFWKLKDHPDYLSKDTFTHEMGHLVGQGLSDSHAEFADVVPPGWAEAAKMDAYKVSDYAGMSPNEDFAETWAVYAKYRDNPYTMASLREQIPHRLELIDAIVAKERETTIATQTQPRQPEGNGNG